jgi:hypothetical protein
VKNEEALQRVKERGISYIQYKEGRLTGFIRSYAGTAF